MDPSKPERTEELAALYGIGSAILSTLDVEAVLQRVCDNAQRLLNADGAMVTEYHEESGEFFLHTCSGSFVPALHHTFPAEKSLSARALSHGEAVVDNDVPHGHAGAIAAKLPVPIDRALIALLNGREGILGTLVCTASKERDPFTEADAQLLTAFATQAALAVENARYYQTEKTRAQELELLRRQREEQIQRLHDLHAAGLAVTSDLDLDELLHRVAQEARKLTRAEYGALGILDDEKSELAQFITSGMPGEEVAEMGPLPQGHGLLGAVIREDTTIRLSWAQEDKRSSAVPEGHPAPTSFLGVPVRVRGEAIGNLYLINKAEGLAFTEQDETIVKMLAAQAAVAIENARLFAESERLLAELEAAHRARNRLHAYVNHDLRNALHGVSLWAERLEQGASATGDSFDPEEVSEIARKILRGGTHALRLVRDVLDLARLEEGRLQTWPRRVVINDLVEAAMDAIAPEADRRGVEVVFQEPETRMELVADPDRVLQITLNLLSNAVKFSPSNGTVSLGASAGDGVGTPLMQPEGGWVAIWVKDEGPGIAPEDLERAWGEFQQVSPDESGDGSGIGLALSRQMAEHMGGTLTVETAVGQGSRFTLWMPAGMEKEERNGWIG
ncbi:MAG: GAF domain-containing protein [Gemmatimonadetes bacterium]|nr:GAF domain-containing protein [Gemmatimonadota bacterium]NNM06872.1 GAF domain-containing protein [Gemmatimonadota bacterium]